MARQATKRHEPDLDIDEAPPRDISEEGEQQSGASSDGRSKITDEQRVEMLRMHGEGLSYAAIGAKVGLPGATVRYQLVNAGASSKGKGRGRPRKDGSSQPTPRSFSTSEAPTLPANIRRLVKFALAIVETGEIDEAERTALRTLTTDTTTRLRAELQAKLERELEAGLLASLSR